MMKRLTFVFICICSFTFIAIAAINSGFYRIRNVNANTEYLSIVNDSIDAQTIVGSASSLASDEGAAAMGRVGQYLDIDIKTTTPNDVYSNIGSIIYLEQQSGSTKNFDIIAQGVGLKYISYCAYVGSSAGAYVLDGIPATIEETSSGSGIYTAKVTLNKSVQGYTINQTRYLGDVNHKLTLSETASDNSYYWYIEPINLTDNYFCVAPIQQFAQYGKYYTTLRTAFSYKVPEASNVKIYKATGLPSTAGEVATLVEMTKGSIIPAGMPVIVESTSLNTLENILEPYYNASTAPIVKSVASASTSGWLIPRISSASITISGLTNSDVLYNNYGRHGHDAYTAATHTSGYGSSFGNAWYPKGDGIGFFATKEYHGNTIYKLGIKDGRVGFWDMVEQGEIINGNEAYSPIQCALFPIKEEELKTIVNEGYENSPYVISNNLFGVKVVDGILYAKDYGMYETPSVRPSEAIDYMAQVNLQDAYDQSNWVALNVTNPDSYVAKDLKVTGTLLRKPNPEMTVSSITASNPATSGYTPNIYIPANFMGETQTSTVGNHNTYFFVSPKPQEYAHITWAVYGGNGKFYVAAPEGSVNQAQLKGGFVAYDAFMPSGATLSSFTVGNTYEFDAIIQRNTASKATPYTEGGLSNDWVVYPLTTPSVITAVSDVNTTKTISGIKYFNLAGMASDVPFDGINIRVTTFSDGSKQTTKVMY
ncbi:MAG: hypothetical protein J5523_05000 [Muribaculaceae bacterium]|nr:hypothetical protein [Muribaculaceae bacterium]